MMRYRLFHREWYTSSCEKVLQRMERMRRTIEQMFNESNEYYRVHCYDHTRPYEGVIECMEAFPQEKRHRSRCRVEQGRLCGTGIVQQIL